MKAVKGPAAVGTVLSGVRRRRAARPALVLLLVVAGLLLPASPASAHAQLQSATPAAGARLKTAPSSVTLHLSETVEVTPDAVQVYDGKGRRVDAAAAHHPAAGDSWVVAPLRPALPDGTYAVTWRAVSDDAHPVHGAFTFVVGSGALGNVSAPGSGGGSDVPLGLAFAVVRWALFGGLALLIGRSVFVLLCWPAGRIASRARWLLWGGWVAVSTASVLALVLQGPYTRGTGRPAALTWSALDETLRTRYGAVLSLRLVLLGLVAMWLTTLLPRWDGAAEQAPAVPGQLSPAAVATGAMLGIWLLFTWPATGHAGAGSQVLLAAPVDVAHVAAMCVWLGGLALLSLTLLPARGAGGPDGPSRDLARALPVFSRLAFSSVVILVVTGTYQSWRQVGTLAGFTGTSYGRLLLVKLIAFVALMALGNVGRMFVRRHYDARPSFVAAGGPPTLGISSDLAAPEPALVGGGRGGAGRSTGANLLPAAPDETSPPPVDPVQLARLRRSLLAELMIAVVILALTAVLVAMAPARDTYHAAAHATTTTTVRLR